MGRSYVQKKYIQPETFFNVFSYHQIYLLQSLLLKDKLWSHLSKKELQTLFDKLLFALSQTKNKGKYKKSLLKSLNTAKILIQKEQSIKLKNFYLQISQPVIQLLSEPSSKKE